MLIVTLIEALALSWLRLFIGIVISILLAFGLGILAGVNRTAERIIIPLIDILQSIPILGFFPVAVICFITFFPIIGAEMAAVFLIITSQLWNLIFAVYESVKSIPSYILETVELSKLSVLQKIAKVYIPSSWPRIIDNLPLSWAGGLFFLSSSEIISLGTTSYQLLGIGSMTFILFSLGDYNDIAIAFLLLFLALVATHMLFFRPLNIWSQKFKYETTAEATAKVPWFISSFFRTTKPLKILAKHVFIPRRPLAPIFKKQYAEPPYTLESHEKDKIISLSKLIKFFKWIITPIFIILILLGVFLDLKAIINIVNYYFKQDMLLLLVTSAAYSALRIAIATAIMLPIIFLAILAVTNSFTKRFLLPIFLFLASFPAPMFIPYMFILFGNNVELISIAVIISGSIWYIFYNTYSSLRLLPSDLKEVVELSKLSKLQKFTKLYLPAMLPGLVTGLVTAIGGAWNALIVAEWIQIGNSVYSVNFGLGKILDEAANIGDLNLLYAPLLFMVIIVVLLDRLFWKRLYNYVTNKFKYET